MKRLLAILLCSAFAATGFAADDAAPKKLYSAKHQRDFYLGLAPHPKEEPDRSFRVAEVKVPNRLYWPDKVPLPAGLPFDQGQCGSCVVNAVVAAVMYNMAIREALKLEGAPLSRGQVMNCNPRAGQCNGDWASNVGGWIGSRGHLLAERSYPYTPRNGRCLNYTGEEFGPIPTGQVVDNSPATIGRLLVSQGPINTTIGADRNFMNADADYPASSCTRQGTNHEVTIIGIRAKGAAAGADGFINFAAARPSEIEVAILNSWGLVYAKDGIVWMPITAVSGRLCNNVTEEIYAFNFEPLPEPKPPAPPVPPAPKPDAPQLPIWSLVLLGLGVIAACVVVFFRNRKKVTSQTVVKRDNRRRN